MQEVLVHLQVRVAESHSGVVPEQVSPQASRVWQRLFRQVCPGAQHTPLHSTLLQPTVLQSPYRHTCAGPQQTPLQGTRQHFPSMHVQSVGQEAPSHLHLAVRVSQTGVSPAHAPLHESGGSQLLLWQVWSGRQHTPLHSTFKQGGSMQLAVA
jgi:hypothetical protein